MTTLFSRKKKSIGAKSNMSANITEFTAEELQKMYQEEEARRHDREKEAARNYVPPKIICWMDWEADIQTPGKK